MAVILLTGAFWPEIDILWERLHLCGISADLQKRLGIEDRAKTALPEQRSLFGARASPSLYWEILPTGIGPVACALELQRRISAPDALPILEILFFGSAGLYPSQQQSRYAPEKTQGRAGRSFICSRSFSLYDMALLAGFAKQPEQMSSYVQTQAGAAALYFMEFLSACALPKGSCITADQACVNSTLSISLSDPHTCFRDKPKSKAYKAEMKACPQWENLEAFALASAALRAKLPFCAFLALTNIIGPRASLEWHRHHRPMSLSLQNYFLASLAS